MREKMETGRTRKLEWGVGADMSFLQGHFMILMSSQTFGERKKNKKTMSTFKNFHCCVLKNQK